MNVHDAIKIQVNALKGRDWSKQDTIDAAVAVSMVTGEPETMTVAAMIRRDLNSIKQG